MKLSQIRKVRSATVDLGDGQQFTITYRAFTPEEWDAGEKEAESLNEFSNLMRLSKVLVSTGLEDDQGKPIPPTREGLRRIETPILNGMIAAVLGTTLPKKENSESSAGGMQPAANSADQ